MIFSGLIYAIMKSNKRRELQLQLDIDKRSHQLVQKQIETDEVLKIVEQQRDELNQINKTQIENFHAFSHQIRTPLQLIRGPVDLIITNLKELKNKDVHITQNLKLLEKYNAELINYTDRLLKVISENYQLSREYIASENQAYTIPIPGIHKDQINNPIPQLSEEIDKIKLLIIDDIEDIRDYLKLALMSDYYIKTASSGFEALSILEQFKPDLIISDIMMPEMDGFTFAKNLYEKSGFEHSPLLFLTAKDSDEDRFRGLQSGAVAYLTKPVNITILKAQIHSIVKREFVIQKEKSIQKEQSEFKKKINELILRHISNADLSLETLADALHMSKSTLYRNWKDESEETLANYILAIRLKETLRLVQEQEVSFAEASSLCGFNNPSYFSRAFKKVYGCTPSEYREKMN
jgi:DNA-binding response OmpR family regulator